MNIENPESKRRTYRPQVKDLGLDSVTGLHVFDCRRVTIVRRSDEFERKGLATHGVECGFKCAHACKYCSVPANIRMHGVFKAAGKSAFEDGYAIIDTQLGDRIGSELKLGKDDTVIISSLSDAWDPVAQRYDTGRKVLQAVLENTQATVRILTKNAAVIRDFDLVEQYRDRVMVGLSITGLPEHDSMIQAVEPFASPVSERIRAMDLAHSNGFRCFAMFCPLLPGPASQPETLHRLFQMARDWNAEGVWLEGVNARGKALPDTEQALRDAGYSSAADAVKHVRNRRNWSSYVRELTVRAQAAARSAGLIDNLRVLNYRSSFTEEDVVAINTDATGVIWL